jgi:hypothetical protein
VIRTIDFAPTSQGRYEFLAQRSAIFCAGLVSAVTFAVALYSPADDMAVIAGAFQRGAHAFAPTTASSLSSAATTQGPGQRDEHGQGIHPERVAAVIISAVVVALPSERTSMREGAGDVRPVHDGTPAIS